jgi:hypothetical protein
MTRGIHALAAVALLAGVLIVGTKSANAALPPYWQSAKEITTILNDQRVHDALKYEEPILSVSTAGDNVYVIKTPRCSLSVTIVDAPQAPGAAPLIGPRQFDLEVGTATCQ